jgi:hypothetical protein
MADIIYDTPKAEVRIHWGKYIRDGKVTDEGMPVIKEAMMQFGKGILKEKPSYFNKKEIHNEEH